MDEGMDEPTLKQRLVTLECMVAALTLALEGVASALNATNPDALRSHIMATRLQLQDIRQGRAASRGPVAERALRIHLELLERACAAPERDPR